MALSDEILASLKAKKGGGPPMKPGGAAEDAADGGADDAAEGDGSDSYGSDEETAASDILAAKDPAALAEALKAFLDICVPKIVDGLNGGGQ